MNPSPHLVAIGGTTRPHSVSRLALTHALGLARARGATTTLLDLPVLNLPMYDPGRGGPDDYPAESRAGIQTLIDQTRAADVLLWACPTYHGTVSGIFKNAIDFIELLGDDTPPYLSGRAVGLVSINDSKTLSAMANSVHELRAWLAPTHIVLNKAGFDANGAALETANRQLGRLVDELLGFAQRQRR
jgi:FMN reductase